MFDNKLQSAVRLALGMGAGAFAVGFAPGALAQDTAAESDEVLEEIVTTGSRIKRADLDSASPVTVLQRDDILAGGLTDVGNIIQKMPSMSGSPIGTTTNNGGSGAVLIDLRGMGTARTVTLINGQRTVDGGDFQTIPSTMIERVEVLKDGASAVYGADAVSGVVNIITRKDFEGIEVTAQTADWFDTDSGAQYSFGFLAGANFDRGNFVFGAEYVDQEEAYQADAPWKHMQNSYYLYPQGCENQLTAPYTGQPDGGCIYFGSSRIPESRLAFATQGVFLIGTPASQPYEVGTMVAHDGRTYNYAPVNYLQTPYERTNIFMEGSFEVSDNVLFTAELRTNERSSRQELAPVPYTPGDPFHSGIWTNPDDGSVLTYEGISENNYYLRRAVDAYNAANPGANLRYEPVTDARRRMIETGRSFEQDITQTNMIFKFEGTLANDIDWELFYNRGSRDRVDVDFGQFSGARLNNALGPSADLDGDGQPECYASPGTDPGGVDAATLIQGCVPLNLFGGGVVDPVTSQPVTGTLTDDMIAYVAADLADIFSTRQELAGLSFTGDMFELPGGALGWAAGVGWWDQHFTYTPDSGKQTSAVTGNVGFGTDGSLTNTNAFLELLAPLFDNGSQELLLKAGVRWDDYDAFGDDTTWQVGLEFQVIDSLKFRSTAGTVFRAPTISDLYSGQRDSFPTYTDPCLAATFADNPGCAQVAPPQLDTQVRTRVGGNPNVQPETGDTLTAGIVFQPDLGDHGLTITADYWDVQLDDGISSFGIDFLLTDCYRDQNAGSCAKLTRNPDYSLALAIDTVDNVSERGANGVDTEIRWDFESGIGLWEVAMLWSHTLEQTLVELPGDPERNLEGLHFENVTTQNGGTYAEDKINTSVQWANGGFSVSYLAEYISGIEADTVFFGSDYIQDIDSFLYHDLTANYEWEGLTVTAGVTNLTDEEPPWIDSAFNAKTDVTTYRMFGRGYFVRLKYGF
ncbi:MAG: TonB-dependent receptor [Woeseiaceae bacterium]|nr:TonB-dependent receptor [Woeseiaceae bacterium]